jgi:hypothetical protein
MPSSGGNGDETSSVVRRFEREAQVTAQLRSPHTVELWDFGVADDEEPGGSTAVGGRTVTSPRGNPV